MVRENRYYVLKNTDIDKCLTGTEHKILELIGYKIENWRRSEGKDQFKAVVVEHDWLEYEKVWKMIEKRVDKQEVEYI